MAEPKRKAYRTKCAFGDTAPAYTLPFPKKANLTAVEILAFLPNSIKRADVVYRMISNGGTRKSIYTIVNTHRDLGAEWSANCCGEAMYKTMQKAGFTKWTIKRHDLWHADRKASWDRTKLDVGDLQTVHGVPGRDVSFRTLADNVRMMPEGHDALDLTKMIQYCVQNPEDEWRYPQDYEELLDLLGGPAEVREENADEAVFGRWEDRKPPPPIAKPTLPPRGIEPLDEGTETGRRVNVGDKPCTERLSMLSPRSGSLIRSKTAVRIAQTGTESVADGGLTAETLPNGGCGTPYVREPTQYVRPPFMAVPPTSAALANAFDAEGAVGEADLYSAYAFGGPRCTPPYRYLSQITQPYSWDVSGWAETLRWAFEQRVLFAHSFPEATGWNESPGHMTCIERERKQRVWASDELLEQLMESDESEADRG